MTGTIQKRLEEMLATISAATSEPWHVSSHALVGTVIHTGSLHRPESTVLFKEVYHDGPHDAYFVTQSRTDWERTVKAILIAIKAFENLADLYPEFKSDTGLVLKKIEDALHGQA